MGTGLIEARMLGLRAARAVAHDVSSRVACGGALKELGPGPLACPAALDRVLGSVLDGLALGVTPREQNARLAAWPAALGEIYTAGEWRAGLRWAAARAILAAVEQGTNHISRR